MNWPQFVQDYLRFPKKERLGILIFLVIILTIIFVPLLLSKNSDVSVKEDKFLLAAIDSLKTKQTHQDENNEDENKTVYQFETSVRNNDTKLALFQFDPNSLSAEEWKKLGLKERTIQTIEKYRNKGGRFYKQEDLKKIWGLPPGFYERVKDYITIANKKNEEQNTAPIVYTKKEKKTWNVEINSADTTALIELPGIGSKLALRIINFRERLGGFYSVDQIAETYGLADSTFQKIKPYLHINADVKKININTATKDQLKIHPYIKWNLANIIVEYRNQHGNYKTIEDLKNIPAIDETAFNKISHYVIL